MRYELLLWYYALLKSIPGKIGCKIRSWCLPCSIGTGSKIWNNVQIDSPRKLSIGTYSSINRGCILNCAAELVIGNDVLIGPNVVIYTQNHNFKSISRPIRQQGYTLKPVHIHDDVWIASGCIILPGVTIGKGSIIAAGSIVTTDIPDYSISAGTPARVIRNREEQS